ncbi:MAG: hypothetical protein KatS3mg076_2755 [Candidatus Binatia bacterium]|nr:MAG: hypothetical protein KatS3mg076_2755 [Candidatus Binatia bacterium]
MSRVTVKQTRTGDPLEFRVVVEEKGSSTRHRVKLSRATLERLGRACGKELSGEECVEAAFSFLLDREPKESILAEFDVDVISRYFPEFEREFPRYLGH